MEILSDFINGKYGVEDEQIYLKVFPKLLPDGGSLCNLTFSEIRNIKDGFYKQNNKIIVKFTFDIVFVLEYMRESYSKDKYYNIFNEKAEKTFEVDLKFYGILSDIQFDNFECISKITKIRFESDIDTLSRTMTISAYGRMDSYLISKKVVEVGCSILRDNQEITSDSHRPKPVKASGFCPQESEVISKIILSDRSQKENKDFLNTSENKYSECDIYQSLHDDYFNQLNKLYLQVSEQINIIQKTNKDLKEKLKFQNQQREEDEKYRKSILNDLKNVSNELKDKNSLINRLNAAIDHKDNTISILKAKNNELNNQVISLKKELEELKDLICDEEKKKNKLLVNKIKATIQNIKTM
ncbi:MAG TPA: hypothetical protein VF941_06725 [Clostridia bacterium]